MSAPTPRRRGHTRWLLTIPLAGLTLIILGVVVLEALAPEADIADHQVTDLPPVALEDETACTRRADEEIDEGIREEFPPQGRVSSTQVYLCPEAFDGLRVTYIGEVVGEVLPRRGGAWAQVNDDDYALETGPLVGHREQAGFNSGMSVWLPNGLHEQIEHAGGPGRRGDVIQVQGVLLRADPDDGGGITVRADDLEVVAESVEVEDPLHGVQALVAAVLALLAVATVVWSRRVRQR
jgi:hypothetical protein